MGRFARQIDEWKTKTGELALEKARSRLLELFAEIVMRTPVKSGKARGNWVCSVGGAPGHGEKEADADGAKTIAAIKVELARLKPGQIVTLANNMPYIVKLEYGASGQAPEGMVRLAVAKFAGKR